MIGFLLITKLIIFFLVDYKLLKFDNYVPFILNKLNNRFSKV